MGYLGVLAIVAITVSVIALISIIEPVEASAPFIAEIRYFPYNFAPRDWAFCDGQLLPIAQNTALFALIGTTYGGDGRTTTALPNMQGRYLMDDGRGPGLTDRRLGERLGTETVTLSLNQMPVHNHSLDTNLNGIADEIFFSPLLRAGDVPGDSALAKANSLGMSFGRLYSTLLPNSVMHTDSIMVSDTESTGGNQAHNNLQPYIVLNCNIALVGVFPSRS